MPYAWWRHQMETFSTLLDLCEGNPPVTGGFPSQRPVTWSFDVFFDLRLNEQLSKQSRCRWFETPSCPLRRHCNRRHSSGSTLPWVMACCLMAPSQYPNQCPLQWCHTESHGISDHQHLDCLLSHLFRCTSKKTSRGCVFSVYPLPLWWLREYIYFVLLSSSNRKYRVRSWNNGVRCMSIYILRARLHWPLWRESTD